MSTRLIDLLLGLSRRERILLGCATLVLGLGLGFGLLLPLQDRRLQAEDRLQEARALETWIAERVIEKQSLNEGSNPINQEPVGTSGIERGLVSARLRPALTALTSKKDGAIDLRFDRVDFIQFGLWLNTAHPDWGYKIDSFRLEALEGDEGAGRVAAWISLSPR